MNTLFISDLHLEPTHPAMTALFLAFLQKYTARADALYILGDFFEAWIGDDYLSPFNQSIITALKTFTDSGVPTYFMVGNRDFLIGPEFMRLTGCQQLTDPTIIDLYGTPTLLMHGDTLCSNDHRYLKFRQVVRNPRYQQFFLRTPLILRLAIARLLRWSSHPHQNTSYPVDTNSIMDTPPATITETLLSHNVRQLIHGHTHRPSIHYFALRQQLACRIVLSDWDNNLGNALICTPNGEHRLINFSHNDCENCLLSSA